MSVSLSIEENTRSPLSPNDKIVDQKSIQPSNSFVVVSSLLDNLEKSYEVFELHFNFIKDYFLQINKLNDKQYLKTGFNTKNHVEGLCGQIEEINMNISKLEEQKTSDHRESKEKLFEIFKFVNLKIKPKQKEIEIILKDIIEIEKKRNESLMLALDNISSSPEKFSPSEDKLDEPLIDATSTESKSFNIDTKRQLLRSRQEETEKLSNANKELLNQIRRLSLIEENEENDKEIANAKRRLSLISNPDPNERKKRFTIVVCILIITIVIIACIIVVLHLTH